MRKVRPTMRDIAKLAGVSLGTVSQSLGNRPGVAPETRARVLEAATELGYQPHTHVSSANSLSTVGLLMKQDCDESLTINPFYSYVLAGAERECQRQRLSLMYANIEVDEFNRALGWPPMLSEQRLNGILVVGTFLADTISQISKQAGQMMVLVDAYAPGQRFDSIVSDNVNGAQNAVEYLIDKGHTRIGIVGSSPDSYPSIRERRKGYTRALKQRGISNAYIEDSMLTRESAYDATMRLMRRSPRITAIFACNDNTAIGVMNAANELGLSVPDDLSVIGFDDIDLAQEVTPTLTTVHVDKTLMGVLGVRHLRDRIENPNRPSLTIALSTHLIIRESVCSLI